MVERRVRPSALHPLWNAAGFALGAATALLGPKAAMACTVAVEEVIDQHYRAQSDKLGEDEAPLKAKIDKFRAEELEHRDTGLEHGARTGPGLSAADRRDQGRVAAGDLAGGADLSFWTTSPPSPRHLAGEGCGGLASGSDPRIEEPEGGAG